MVKPELEIGESQETRIVDGNKSLVQAVFDNIDSFVFPKEKSGELLSVVQKVLGRLNETQRDTLMLFYGLEDGILRDINEVARVKSMNPDYIRRVHKKALSKLRHPSSTRHLQQFLA